MAQVIYEFELPDGSILEIEGDEGKQAEATAKAKEYIAAQQPTTKKLGRVETSEDLRKSLASGVYKGLTSIPGAVGDIEELALSISPEIMKKPSLVGLLRGETEARKIFPTTQEIRTGIEKYFPSLESYGTYEPKTVAGGYLQTIPEFAAPGLLGKTQAVRKLGTGLGLFGGATYETTEQLTGSPGAAAAITIPSMLLAGKFKLPGREEIIAKQATKDIKPQEFKDAIDLQGAAEKLGIRLLPGEVLDDKRVLELTEAIYGTPIGSKHIYSAISKRPKLVKDLAEEQANAIAEMPESQREVLKIIKWQ